MTAAILKYTVNFDRVISSSRFFYLKFLSLRGWRNLAYAPVLDTVR